jgi:ABC-type nitrate/sulfonate/bicarbonate transport system ATPase subunit
LGKSGAGKTTLLNILAGTCGYGGEVVAKPDSVGYVFQENRLISHLTVKQNLQFVGGRDEVINELLHFSGMERLSERKAGLLSGGEKRRVALLRAFCVEADVILLDEPFTALDTATKESMLALAFKLIKTGKKTAVFVTHDLDEALSVADKIAVLDEGKIVFEMRLPPSKNVREYGSMNKERMQLLESLRLTKTI